MAENKLDGPDKPAQRDDIVRVLRLVEYEGSRVAVEEQLRNSIQGTRVFRNRSLFTPQGDLVRITAVTLDQFPRVLDEARAEGLDMIIREQTRLIQSLRMQARELCTWPDPSVGGKLWPPPKGTLEVPGGVDEGKEESNG